MSASGKGGESGSTFAVSMPFLWLGFYSCCWPLWNNDQVVPPVSLLWGCDELNVCDLLKIYYVEAPALSVAIVGGGAFKKVIKVE